MFSTYSEAEAALASRVDFLVMFNLDVVKAGINGVNKITSTKDHNRVLDLEGDGRTKEGSGDS